jgi:catechol 2,3-dioxygenase-like lactoylglutathione lyase family enzyme
MRESDSAPRSLYLPSQVIPVTIRTEAELMTPAQVIRDKLPNDLAIPILPSRSLPSTLAFFARLGFEGEILGEGDAYAILTRGDLELHFVLHAALVPAESWAGCYLRVADVESLYKAFSAAGLPRRGIPRMDAIENKPWGMREFAIVDEDGNLLRVGQVL